MPFTEEEKKQRRKISDAKSYQKNKEKRQKTRAAHYQKNKEKLDKINKEWIINNKERRNEIVKKNKIRHPHIVFKCKWKYRGVVWENDDEFMQIWNKYESSTHCQNCNVEFKKEPTKMLRKCLDHCHQTGKFRNIVCGHCNIHVIK